MSCITTRPRLSPKVRLRFDRRTGRYLLLYPETGLDLNGTAMEIARLCTGDYTVDEIVRSLARTHRAVPYAEIERHVNTFLTALAERGLLQYESPLLCKEGYGEVEAALPHLASPYKGEVAECAYRPYTLIAELTYRCPLRCPYCSNPLDYARHQNEIDTNTWLRVFHEAEALGVVQVNLTGGEPLLRDDLEILVEGASKLELYTNLITSGLPLGQQRLSRLRALGLNSVQLSIQSTRPSESERIAGAPSFARKRETAHWVKSVNLPLSINVVLHRGNIAEIPDVITLAEQLSADRLELANAQYLGWALHNRTALLPTRDQVERARTTAAQARDRLQGKMEIVFVTPDYYAAYPKSCMDGWGRRFIVVNPEGLALPCHQAQTLPGLHFENVQQHHLAEIWHHSAGFNHFRGEQWLPDPCRTCARRAIDFGGCRCQAFHVTGKAGATDPACSLSSDHYLIENARSEASQLNGTPIVFEYRSPTGRSATVHSPRFRGEG